MMIYSTINLGDYLLCLADRKFFTKHKVYKVILIEYNTVSVLDDDNEEYRLSSTLYKDFIKTNLV